MILVLSIGTPYNPMDIYDTDIIVTLVKSESISFKVQKYYHILYNLPSYAYFALSLFCP